MKKQRKEIGILIADHHLAFRESLRKALEAEPGFRVLGEAGDGEQTLALVRRLKPEVLLLDIRMPKLSGLEVLREIKTSKNPVHAVMLAATVERDQAIEALHLGARGIVLKHSPLESLFDGIRRVSAGQYWACQESVSELVQALLEVNPRPKDGPNRPKFGMSQRESEAVGLIVSGYTDKEIAEKMHIQEEAVERLLARIFGKLSVANRLELIFFALDHRLADVVQEGPR